MPAIVTPFDADGDLDLDAHRHNVEVLSGLGIEGFVIAGSNGEGAYVEAGERGRLVEATREAAPSAHVMGCVMGESVRQGTAQIAEVAAGGADSILALTPTTLTRGRPHAVLEYFTRLADASPLPVFLYSVPPNTAYSMPVELVVEMAKHDNVVGMKDSSGDVVRLQAIVDATPDDFLLYSGSSPAMTGALVVGCYGVITGSVNYVPRLVMDVVQNAPDRDLQVQLTAVSRKVEAHGVPGVKAAAVAAGLKPGWPRLPLVPVGEQVAAELEEAASLE